MKPLIIIPTYNEAENLTLLITKIQEILSEKEFSILIVDDSSNDGTSEIAEKLSKEYHNVHIINRPAKLGLASAYIDGIKFGIKSGYDAFIEMDADFSHNPKYLTIMLEKLEKYDAVIGSRNIKGGGVIGWSFLRNFISKGGSLYSRLMLGCPIKDFTGGFNGYKLEIINKINLDKIISKGYSFQVEMKYRAYINGAKIYEFPIIFENRKFGESKMSKTIFAEALINIIKLKLFCKK